MFLYNVVLGEKGWKVDYEKLLFCWLIILKIVKIILYWFVFFIDVFFWFFKKFYWIGVFDCRRCYGS